MVPRNNADLQSHYEDGHDYTFDSAQERGGILRMLGDELNGETVLEIGCGDGRLARRMWGLGASVIGIDYADRPLSDLDGLEFYKEDYRKVKGEFTTVVMQGVLEHMDDPLETLTFIQDTFRPGRIVTSSPSFLNPRGYVWMALVKLFDVPMSLSDIHYICPFNMEEWAQELGASLEYESVDQDWGHGHRLLTDFEKRLTNALKDAGMRADVSGFLAWLRNTTEYQAFTGFSGATIVYQLSFKD